MFEISKYIWHNKFNFTAWNNFLFLSCIENSYELYSVNGIVKIRVIFNIFLNLFDTIRIPFDLWKCLNANRFIIAVLYIKYMNKKLLNHS